MTKMLASVNNLQEALIALEAGVDIIDLKDPNQGALGALDSKTINAIVTTINHRRPVSATLGDIAFQPDTIISGLQRLSGANLDYIKMGIFPDADISATLAEIHRLGYNQQKLIAVLFADSEYEVATIQTFAEGKFHGVMLDTADKKNGSLLEVMDLSEIELFIQETKRNHLLCGLAGSLKISDIPELLPLFPDYIGFRGALCNAQQRTNDINPDAVSEVIAALAL